MHTNPCTSSHWRTRPTPTALKASSWSPQVPSTELELARNSSRRAPGHAQTLIGHSGIRGENCQEPES